MNWVSLNAPGVPQIEKDAYFSCFVVCDNAMCALTQGKVHIARAPHALGLFGGTCAHYSGGTSLYAASSQACLVACQLQQASKLQTEGTVSGSLMLLPAIAHNACMRSSLWQ